jgi:hypothetical protein
MPLRLPSAPLVAAADGDRSAVALTSSHARGDGHLQRGLLRGLRAASAPAPSSTEHFGGSTYLQIAVEGARRGERGRSARSARSATSPSRSRDRRRRRRAQRRRAADAVLNEALGGRAASPRASPRRPACSPICSGHPAVAQLMTLRRPTGALDPRQARADEPGDRQSASPTEVRGLRSLRRRRRSHAAVATSDPAGARRAARGGRRAASARARPPRRRRRCWPAGVLGATPRRRCWPPSLQAARSRARLRGQPRRRRAARADRQPSSPQSLLAPRGAELEAICCASRLPEPRR